MIREAYYINSKGVILNFLVDPYYTAEADWYDSEWNETASGYQKTVQVDVYGSGEGLAKNMEKLYSVLAVDADLGVHGKLYVNDTFLSCRVEKSKKSNWKGFDMAEVELTFTAPSLSWMTVVSQQLFPQSQMTAASGLDFPFDFPFDFADVRAGTAEFEIDHPSASDFKMTIYGPCTNPKILINGYPYEVRTTLERNEYMIIDSAEQTVYKYLTNGTVSNLFNERGYEYSIFEKIPSGLIRVNWAGTYGIDLDIFPERREAAW